MSQDTSMGVIFVAVTASVPVGNRLNGRSGFANKVEFFGDSDEGWCVGSRVNESRHSSGTSCGSRALISAFSDTLQHIDSDSPVARAAPARVLTPIMTTMLIRILKKFEARSKM